MRFRNLLSEFAQERIVLISTHIVSDVEYIAAENAVMKAGKIVAQDTTEGLVKQIEAKVWQGEHPDGTACPVGTPAAGGEPAQRAGRNGNIAVSGGCTAAAGQRPGTAPAGRSVSVAVPGGNGGSKMNLYRLELKRVCKTRMTAILLAIALVLAVVMAYLPVTFIGWTELDASGNEVRYTGLKAIQKRQEQQVSGTITPDVMQEALETYQRVYRQYDASSINDIPVEVFYKELARYQPLVNNAKEAFADPKTGMAPGVMGLTAEDMQNFYSQLPKRLESVIWLEQDGKPGYEQAQAIAQKKVRCCTKTVHLFIWGQFRRNGLPDPVEPAAHPAVRSDCSPSVCIGCTDRSAGHPTVHKKRRSAASSGKAGGGVQYHRGGVSALRRGVDPGHECSIWLEKYPNFRAMAVFCDQPAAVYRWPDGVGHAGGKLPDLLCGGGLCADGIRMGQEQPDRFVCGADQCGGTADRLYGRAGSFGEWLSTLLPAGGIGLSNALMYKMISFDFLYAGGHAFFQADVLLASAPIKIVLLVGLAAWGYLRKTKGGLSWAMRT